MRHLTRSFLVAGLSALLAVLSACGSSGDGADARPVAGRDPGAGDPSSGKLAQIRARGTLILFTDPAYEPQSYTVEGAARKAPTKCAANELTAPQIAGYDADTGKIVAHALGVEPCFVTPSWTEVTAGNWGDRWDLAYGSGAIAADRMQVLYMTQPYYSTPANFFVPTGSTAQEPADLSGKRVRACAGCTMEDYLRGTLELPGPHIDFLVDQAEVVTFDTEVPGSRPPQMARSTPSSAPSRSGPSRSMPGSRCACSRHPPIAATRRATSIGPPDSQSHPSSRGSTR